MHYFNNLIETLLKTEEVRTPLLNIAYAEQDVR